MQIYVINPYQTSEPHFPIIGMVSDYYSYLWNVQLYGLGYFELTVAATSANINLLKVGRFLVRECDIRKNDPSDAYPEYKNAMIIRTATIVYDAEQGHLLQVTGKSVKDILSQRIIWEPFEWADSELNAVLLHLIDANVASPTNYSGNEKRMASDALTGAQNAKNAAQTTYNNARSDYNTSKAAYETSKATYDASMAAYEAAVNQYGQDSPEAKAAKDTMDWDKVQMEMDENTMQQTETTMNEKKVILDAAVADLAEAQAKYDYYAWFDSVSALREIPYVNVNIIELPSSPEVTIQLYGENLGTWAETICEEYGIGWTFYLDETGLKFQFIEGTDKSSTVIFSEDLDNLKNAEYNEDLLIYKNAGLATGEGEGFHQVVADIGSASGKSRYEEFISTGLTKSETTTAANYKKQVKQYGQSEITKSSKYKTISGEIDTDGVFKIDQDFTLGDIVKVQMMRGIEATTKLIEIIYSDETDGTRTTGTFQEWEVN